MRFAPLIFYLALSIVIPFLMVARETIFAEDSQDMREAAKEFWGELARELK